MSVDPDDNTPGGIMDTGAEIITYGARTARRNVVIILL